MKIIITAQVKKCTAFIASFFLFILFFTNVENVKSSIRDSFRFCVNSLIPSIFIFMVISLFFLYSSVFSGVFNILPKGFFKKIGICRKYFATVLLCSLCGFVGGPKIICEDYKQNHVNEQDFSNAIILSSNAGIGFLVSCVGIGIWNDAWFGISLYLFQMLSVFMLGKRVLKHSEFELSSDKRKEKSLDLSVAFTRAVTTSCSTVISICTFVVAFSCFISVTLSFLGISEDSIWYAVVTSIFEFCRGSFLVFNTRNFLFSAFLSGFCVGFGGICVHFQTFAVCEGLPLNKFEFVKFKAIHGVLCGFFCVLYMLIKNFLL